jgi:hypothetical protein
MTAENPTPSTPEEMSRTIDEAKWEWLRPHLERDVLILVSPGIELVDAGQALAQDNTPLIQELITAGRLSKPTPSQISVWDSRSHDYKFLMLIVSPYILIQEIPLLMQ